MSSKKQVLLVINPCAGPDRGRASVEEIVSLFSEDEYQIEVQQTTCQGDGLRIVREFADGKELIICAGGDGTLNEVINGVLELDKKVTLGYIPTGSTNDLATTLGIPTKLEEAVELIKSGETNSYDIGLFGDRHYCYVASFGAFTRSSYATSQKMKNRLGHFAYLLNGFKAWSTIKSSHVHIEYDGGVIDDDIMLGAVSNSTSVAGILKFKKDTIKLNDGYFEILLVKKIRPIQAPSMLHKLLKQDYSDGRIFVARTKYFRMTSEQPVAWTVDGEYGGDVTDIEISVKEKAINIISKFNPLFLPKE